MNEFSLRHLYIYLYSCYISPSPALLPLLSLPHTDFPRQSLRPLCHIYSVIPSVFPSPLKSLHPSHDLLSSFLNLGFYFALCSQEQKNTV